MLRSHSEYTAAAFVQVAHNIAGIFVFHGHLHGNDRLKENRRSFHKAFLEGHLCCGLERHFRRIHRMVRTVVQCRFYADNRICGKRTCLYGVLKAFFHCREIVLRNRAADNLLRKFERFIKISGRLKTHFYVSILSVSAGLFLIFCFHIRFLADGLTERNLRFAQFQFYFVTFLQFADNDVNVLIAHAVNQSLMVCRIVDNFHGKIFLHHFLECLGNLIYVCFIFRFVTFRCIRNGNFRFSVTDRRRFGCQGISGLRIAEFCDRADISRVEFRNLDRFGSFQYIEFVQLFFGFLIYIIQNIVALDNSGANLDHGIFSDKRIDNGFEDRRRFGFLEIVICLEDFVGRGVQTCAGTVRRTREIAADVIQQVGHTLKIDRRTHTYRNERTVSHVHRQSSGNLRHGELLAAKIAIHKFLAGLSDRFHQSLAVFLQIFFGIFRNLTLFFLVFINITAAFVLYNINIADEFFVFTDWHVQRSDPFSIQLR